MNLRKFLFSKLWSSRPYILWLNAADLRGYSLEIGLACSIVVVSVNVIVLEVEAEYVGHRGMICVWIDLELARGAYLSTPPLVAY